MSFAVPAVTPSYFEAAAADPSVVGDRTKMLSYYRSDAAAWAKEGGCLHPPPPLPRTAAASSSSSPGSVRIASWNINNLCGVASEGAEATAVAALLHGLDADVIVLQEAISDAAPYTDPPFEAACSRVAQLDSALVAMGFIHTARSRTATCTAIYSKLPFVQAPESIDLDGAHQWKDKIKTCVGKLTRDAGTGALVGAAAVLNQQRAAIYAVVQLPNGRTVGVCGTHLHHINYSSSPDGCRKAEMQAVLSHLAPNTGDAQKEGGRSAAATHPSIILGDLNQARIQDFCTREDQWRVVTTALNKFDAPADDGVGTILEAAGFRCAWDVTNDGPTDGTAAIPAFRAPPCTHWTGTTVDHVYFKSMKLAGVCAVASGLSDHFPVVADFLVE